MYNLIEIKQLIGSQKAVLLYFSAHNCSVCDNLKEKIHNTFSTCFPSIKQVYLNAATSKEITSNYGIFSFPTFLVFFEGNEFFRQGRNLSINEFTKNVERIYEMVFKENK